MTLLQTNRHQDIVYWHFSADQLRDPELVSRLVQRIAVACDMRVDSTFLQLVVVELINNAIDHGVLKLESAMKAEANGFTRYYNERERRLADLNSGWIEVSIELVGNNKLCLRVQDSGSGFDYKSYRRNLQAGAQDTVSDTAGVRNVVDGNASDQEAFGRGLMILNELCDTVAHVGCGNEIVVEIDLDSLSTPPVHSTADRLSGAERV